MAVVMCLWSLVLAMEITTVLFDMDSTLNTIDELAFSSKYFKMLHNKYFNELDVQYFYETLTEITKKVMFSRLPRERNIKTFMREMAKYYKRKPKKLYTDFLEFYSNDYNELSVYVQPAEFGREAVQLCLDKGLEIVLATTPIFPEIAIKKRMDWSGLSDFEFKLVTHAENMYFCKPREEYYLEILKKIKRKAENCIMVGNEFLTDIVGPIKIGMPTFHCSENPQKDSLFVSPELERFSKLQPTFRGNLQTFISLVKRDFQV